MELGSKKYKTRLIIIAIIILVSIVLGTVAERQIKSYADQVDQLVETIQSIPEEEYAERGLKLYDSNESIGYDKQKSLEFMQKIQQQYDQIFKYSEGYLLFLFAFVFSGSIMIIMMYFILSGKIFKKFFPNLKNSISIPVRILILLAIIIASSFIKVLFTILFYSVVTIGVFGQLPFIFYTLYKFIKLKRIEDKDDIIKENS